MPTERIFSFYRSQYSVLVVSVVLSVYSGLKAAAPVEKLSFNTHVQPLLSEYCYHCHGPDSGTRMPKEAPLRLDLEEFAFVPRAHGKPTIIKGNAAESDVVKRMKSTSESDIMPPPESHKAMKPEEIAIIERWINEGAEYEKHWAFIAPKRPTVPTIPAQAPAEWKAHPIDAFLWEKMQAAGLTPNPPEERARLLRRVTFDLTGLPPSPEETAAFLADSAPDAYEKAVDRLLASPRYAENMTRYWLDAARYADTHGIHIDNYRSIWPYRDWVLNAFNSNMPFDRFTIEQIAGDLLPEKTLDQKIATGFNRCLPTTGEGGAIAEEVQAIYAKDRVETTSGVWLGMTMGCAACHDHKFDPIPTRDFYAFAAFFRNTPMSALDGNNADHPPNVFVPAQADRARFNAVQQEIADLQKAMEKRATEATADFEKWLGSAREATAEPADFTRHISLPMVVAGPSLHGEVDGQGRDWPIATESVEGPLGPAPVFKDGKDLVLGNLADVDRGDVFSYGAFVRVDGSPTGAIVSKIDAKQNHRGWDLWIENGKIGAHAIGHWPDAANKILAKRKLESGRWYHVMVTFNGKQAAHQTMALFIDGKKEGIDLEPNTVSGSLRNEVPVRIGRREPQAGGDEQIRSGSVAVQDFRFYKKVLNETEIQSIANGAAVRMALAQAVENRRPEQNKLIRDYYLSHVDGPNLALRAKLDNLKKEESDIRGRGAITLVMEENSGKKATANILERGDYTKPGEEVLAGVPTALPPKADGLPDNRLGLAHWLVAADNPLTGRVTVNRLWHQIFGLGLVETTEDFGIMGARPSHPALLDWLAVEFTSTGWDMKKVLRSLVTTAAYRQSGKLDPVKLEKDPRNILLSRGPRNRLDAEPLRDMALYVSGMLSEKTGGPSVKPYQPEGVWESVAMPQSNTRFYKQDSSEALYRRSLYTFWKRTAPHPAMETLNAPSREVFCTRRERTNTPLQALVLMNDPQFVESSRGLAERVLAEHSDPQARFNAIAMRLLARPLVEAELAVLSASLAEFTATFTEHPERATKLLGVGNSKAKAQNPVEAAAWTLVANQILNMDECLTR